MKLVLQGLLIFRIKFSFRLLKITVQEEIKRL